MDGRITVALVVLSAVDASFVHAQTRFEAHVGPAVLTYSEHISRQQSADLYGQAIAIEFEADLQPAVVAGMTLAVPVGRGGGELVGELRGVVGLEVDMRATAGGDVIQRNSFRQELVEASPRYRWPLARSEDGTRRSTLDLGYRFTFQNLHFIDVPGVGEANERVFVHAIDLGYDWSRRADCHLWGVRVAGSVNYAQAVNSEIDGGDLSGLGFGALVRGTLRRGRLVYGLAVEVRRQNGSDIEMVEFQGMPARAVWPQNTTWIVGFTVGVAVD